MSTDMRFDSCDFTSLHDFFLPSRKRRGALFIGVCMFQLYSEASIILRINYGLL